MKTEIKFDKKVIEEIIKMFDEGSSKIEIQNYLMNEIKEYSLVDKYIRESKLKFKKPSGNWDCLIEYFQECRDNSIEPSKEDMISRLETEREMTKDQSKKYGSSYYYVLSEIFKI